MDEARRTGAMRWACTGGVVALGLLIALLPSCGGGSSSGSSAAPSPAPAPVGVAPPATPFVPGRFVDDAEFRNSRALVEANALPAFLAGGTGRGATLAIIDSGMDADDPEFAGRILPGTPVAGSRSSHGHGMALLAAAARNGVNTMGVAFEASLLVYSAESCTVGCPEPIDGMAMAIDDAVSKGARVINLSIVGPTSREPLFSALARATRAGVVVVIAAGNDGRADPNPLALLSAQAVDSSLLVIAGAHGPDRQPVAITSRAGSGAQWYLSAYSDGGTSASTAIVSGTAALIAGAFPRLTGAQIVQAIYESADDAGAPGVDPVFGHGILNIGRAFERARVLAGA